MAHVIVEYVYDPPLSEEDFQKNGEKLGSCLQAHGVRWVATYLATDRRRRVCIFEAADAESVRASFRSASVAFERVWPASRFAP
jgi:hypothetical protein